jgi:integrase
MTPSNRARRSDSSPYEEGNSVRDWNWPACPNSMSVYDKYANTSAELRLSDRLWNIPAQGRLEKLTYADGNLGLLQRKLTILSQAASAPSTIAVFGRCLISHWPVYEQILVSGPSVARGLWDAGVSDVNAAKAGKTLLKLACKLQLGGWSPVHLPLIRSLDTRAKAPLLAQRGKLKRREKILPVSTQADIVRILDEASTNTALIEEHVEGLAALALFYQHGMRPVQLLSLRLEHLPAPVVDAKGNLSLVVSYHAAKRGDDAVELLRQVKPEWVPLVNRLRSSAIRSGRQRVFSRSSNEELWTLVKAACMAHHLRLDFKAYGVRHTSAQSLADAGHDRKSIREFLGQRSMNAATTYLRASRQQGDIVNKALGASKLYQNILAFSTDSFIDAKQLIAADEDQQIGAVVGSRLVAGIGLCSSGQASCSFNPVTSCYGCSKFMPVAEISAHEEAVAGMREQVQVYLNDKMSEGSPAFMQLRTALSGAQQAIEVARQLQVNP